MIPFWVHPGQIKHDVIHSTVPISKSPEKRIPSEKNAPRSPVCNVSLVHELETLSRNLLELLRDYAEWLS